MRQHDDGFGSPADGRIPPVTVVREHAHGRLEDVRPSLFVPVAGQLALEPLARSLGQHGAPALLYGLHPQLGFQYRLRLPCRRLVAERHARLGEPGVEIVVERLRFFAGERALFDGGDQAILKGHRLNPASRRLSFLRGWVQKFHL